MTESEKQAALEAINLTDSEIMDALHASGLKRESYRALIFERWKDGIEIDVPSYGLELFAKELIYAWMASRAAMPAGDGWMPCDPPQLGVYFIRQPDDGVYTKDGEQWYRFKLPPLPPPPKGEP